MTTARIVGRLFVSGLCLSGMVALAQAQADQQRNQQQTTPQSSTTTQSSQQEQLTPERFAYAAALGGLKEVHLAQMALNKAQKSEVRQAATQILNDHKQANQELMRLASQKGYTLPPTNIFEQTDRQPVGGRDPGDAAARRDREQRESTSAATSDRSTARDTQGHEQMKQECIQDVQRFQAMSGQDFDRAWVQQMVQDHQKAIQKFENASRSLTDNELKKFASDALPKLRSHLEQVQKLASAGGASTQQQQN